MIKKLVRVTAIKTNFDEEFMSNKEESVAKGIEKYKGKGGFANPLALDENYNLIKGWTNYCVAVELGLKYVECEIGTLEEHEALNISRNLKPLPSGLTKDQRRKRMVYMNSHGRCAICGKRITLDDFTIDHIIPKGKQGADSLDNLQATCEECNRMKANMMPEDFYNKAIHVTAHRAERDELIAAELYKATWELFLRQMKRKMISLML